MSPKVKPTALHRRHTLHFTTRTDSTHNPKSETNQKHTHLLRGGIGTVSQVRHAHLLPGSDILGATEDVFQHLPPGPRPARVKARVGLAGMVHQRRGGEDADYGWWQEPAQRLRLYRVEIAAESEDRRKGSGVCKVRA